MSASTDISVSATIASSSSSSSLSSSSLSSSSLSSSSLSSWSCSSSSSSSKGAQAEDAQVFGHRFGHRCSLFPVLPPFSFSSARICSSGLFCVIKPGRPLPTLCMCTIVRSALHNALQNTFKDVPNHARRAFVYFEDLATNSVRTNWRAQDMAYYWIQIFASAKIKNKNYSFRDKLFRGFLQVPLSSAVGSY